jgi:hypothetical protein
MFLGSPASQDHFFIDEKTCRVFISEVFAIPNRKAFNIDLRDKKKRNDHQHAIVNTRKLIKSKLNKTVYHNIRHGAKPLIKSVLHKLDNIFNEELTKTRSNSFRTEEDVLMFHLFEFYCLIEGIGKSKYLRTVKDKNRLTSLLSSNKNFTFGYINFHDNDVLEKLDVIKKENPLILCLNHTPSTPPKNIIVLQKFLEDYYPEKCPFEK